MLVQRNSARRPGLAIDAGGFEVAAERLDREAACRARDRLSSCGDEAEPVEGADGRPVTGQYTQIDRGRGLPWRLGEQLRNRRGFSSEHREQPPGGEEFKRRSLTLSGVIANAQRVARFTSASVIVVASRDRSAMRKAWAWSRTSGMRAKIAPDCLSDARPRAFCFWGGQ